MAEVFEVVLRWGDTILDVQYVRERPRETKRGLVDVFVRATTLPPRSIAYARGDDRKVLPYIALALAVHLAFWAVANSSVPPTEQAIVVEQPKSRVTRIVAAPQVAKQRDNALDARAPGRGATRKDEVGTSGANAEAETGHIAIAKTSSPQVAKEEARTAGILGSTALADQLKILTGSTDLASGFDGATINANLDGREGASHGTFGFTYSGERHGGGSKWDTIGIGDHRGLSNGDTRGDGWGGGETFASTRTPTVWIRIHTCDAADDCVHFGDLDQKTILRFTRKKARDLVNCWSFNYPSPTQMTVDFKIARTGRVERVTAPLGCIEGIYKSIKFPRSRDIGTQVRHVLNFEEHKVY